MRAQPVDEGRWAIAARQFAKPQGNALGLAYLKTLLLMMAQELKGVSTHDQPFNRSYEHGRIKLGHFTRARRGRAEKRRGDRRFGATVHRCHATFDHSG